MFLGACVKYRNKSLAHTSPLTPFSSKLPVPWSFHLSVGQGLQTLVTEKAPTPKHISKREYDVIPESPFFINGHYAFALKSSAGNDLEKPAPSSNLSLIPAPKTTLTVWVEKNVTLVVLPADQEGKRGNETVSPTIRRVLSIASHIRKIDEARAINQSRRMDDIPDAIDWRVPLGILQDHSFDHSLNPSIMLQFLQSRVQLHEPPHARIEDVPIPSKWSKANLAAYIYNITNLHSSDNYNKEDRKYEPQTIQVERQLRDLFLDPTKRYYLSAQALNSAIIYAYRHNMISNVRTFVSVVEEAGIELSVETFNIMLRGTARRKDLQNFTYFLKRMVYTGHRPNIDTWVALISATWAMSAKLHIVRIMREQGFMENPVAVMKIAKAIVTPEIVSHVRSDQAIGSFFDNIDSIYGPDWLSLSAGNMMCHYLVEEGFLLEAFKVVIIMGKRGCFPDQVTLNTLLSYFRRQHGLGSVKAASEIIRQFQTLYNVSPDRLGYDLLFMTCWDARLLNCCKVVWQIACTDLRVSHRMHHLIFRSLLRTTPDRPKSLKDHWEKTAGKVIIGLGNYVRQNTNSHIEYAGTPDELPLTWVEEGSSRDRMRRIARTLIQQDFIAGKTYYLDTDLVTLLATAWAHDKEWAAKDRLRTTTLQWKLENAIKLHLSKTPMSG